VGVHPSGALDLRREPVGPAPLVGPRGDARLEPHGEPEVLDLRAQRNGVIHDQLGLLGRERADRVRQEAAGGQELESPADQRPLEPGELPYLVQGQPGDALGRSPGYPLGAAGRVQQHLGELDGGGEAPAVLPDHHHVGYPEPVDVGPQGSYPLVVHVVRHYSASVEHHLGHLGRLAAGRRSDVQHEIAWPRREGQRGERG